MPKSLQLRLTILIYLLALAGCAASLRSQVETNESRLIPDTISVEILTIKGIMDSKGQRLAVETRVPECKNGNGTVRIASSSRVEYLSNAVANEKSPVDKLFNELCNRGLTIYGKQEADWNRRFAEMTPEQREAQRKLLLQLFLVQQGQQDESNRNASQERAAKSLADAIRDSKKTTTVCTASTPWYVKCETK